MSDWTAEELLEGECFCGDARTCKFCVAADEIKALRSRLEEIMKVIRHCAGESSFDSCNYRADSKPYCTECCRHDYEGHDPMCWRRLAFEEPKS